jgi:hypothetical protein
MGSALGEVLRTEYWGHLATVWLVGAPEFCSAVEAGVASKCLGRENSNYVKLSALKGKLLERMPMIGASKTNGSRSGASTPTEKEEKGSMGSWLGKVKGKARNTEADGASVSSSLYASGADKTETVRSKTVELNSPTKLASASQKSSPVRRSQLQWNQAVSVSTTAPSDLSSNCDGAPQDPTVMPEEGDAPVVKESTLTDAHLKRHLEALLTPRVPADAGCTPRHNGEALISSSNFNPGLLLYPDRITISACVDMDGVDSDIQQLVITRTNSNSLGEELQRLKGISDTVIVSM